MRLPELWAAALLAAASPHGVWAADAPAGSPGVSVRSDFGASDPLLQGPLPRTALGKVAVAPLTPAEYDRLRQAQVFREAGLLDKARATLLGLLADRPHQPLVLTELASVYLAKGDFAAVERLGRAERQAQKDSLLLGRELEIVLERQHHPREAAQVALEVWLAAPAEAVWANIAVVRLLPLDPRGVRETVRRVAERTPERPDLARGLAMLEWRFGDMPAALKALAVAEQPGAGPSLRLSFADDLLGKATTKDSTGAIEVLLDLAASTGRDPALRQSAARRAWELFLSRRAEMEGAPRVFKALADVPPDRWPSGLRVGVARGLRQAGLTAEARALLGAQGQEKGVQPELALERALADLRDGPPERALPGLRTTAESSLEATFRYAEALFFAGESDSALAWYQRVATDPNGPFTGAALERIFLIEEGRPREALPAFGRIAYREWRGDGKGAMALSDSLYRTLPRGPMWAQAALVLATHLVDAADARGALQPLLAVADSLPEDRLAPVARQRAGDIYLVQLKDEAKALAQYEECLARYPRAWNAPEVRRKVEFLRKERRF